MDERNHKVLLVGAKGYSRKSDGVRVDCCPWSSIKKLPNIRDYDTIIINLMELKESHVRAAIDWPSLEQQLNFSSSIDILKHRGAILLLGDPRFKVPPVASTEPVSVKQPKKPFLHWTGIDFIWDSEGGDTVHFAGDYKHSRYENYVSKIKTWNYSLSQCEINKNYLPQYFNLEFMKEKDYEITLNRDFFCVNRYKHALAFVIRFQLQKRYSHHQLEVVDTYGPLRIRA